jgi:hypothetical protein
VKTWILTLAMATAACGSVGVRRVHVSTDAKEDVKGVRVQTAALHRVVVAIEEPGGAIKYRAADVILPSKDEQYEFEMSGGLFRKVELEAALYPNGTLKSYKVDSDQKVTTAVENASGAIDAITKARADAAKAKEPADPVEKENGALKLEVINLMLKANQEALKAGEPLPYPDVMKLL